MALIRRFDESNYVTEFGTLMIRDRAGAEPATLSSTGISSAAEADLAEDNRGGGPCGTIARAGLGWFAGAAGDPLFELGSPWPYRVRVARSPTPSHVVNVVKRAATEHGATMEQIATLARRLHRGDTWLDEPLWPEPRVDAPTGHPDLDAAQQRQRATVKERQERQRSALADAATQLGDAAPTTRRDVLNLLVAAGILNRDESGRYRLPPAWPRVLDVLRLPAEQVAGVKKQEATQRCDELAGDLHAIVAWNQQPLTTTTAELADHLLVPPALVNEVVEYADDRSIMRATWATSARVTLSLTTEPPVPPKPTEIRRTQQVAGPPRGRTSRREKPRGQTQGSRSPGAMFPISGRGRTWIGLSGPEPEPEPASGAPHRAGLIDQNGDVVVWRAGEPTTLARIDDPRPRRAVESAFGVVVLGSAALLLSRFDGTLEEIGDGSAPRQALLSADGRLLTFSTEVGDPGNTRSEVHLVDLADGARQSTGATSDPVQSLAGIVGSSVIFAIGTPGGTRRSVRWRPGDVPEPMDTLVRAVDAASGTMLLSARPPRPDRGPLCSSNRW